MRELSGLNSGHRVYLSMLSFSYALFHLPPLPRVLPCACPLHPLGVCLLTNMSGHKESFRLLDFQGGMWVHRHWTVEPSSGHSWCQWRSCTIAKSKLGRETVACCQSMQRPICFDTLLPLRKIMNWKLISFQDGWRTALCGQKGKHRLRRSAKLA